MGLINNTKNGKILKIPFHNFPPQKQQLQITKIRQNSSMARRWFNPSHFFLSFVLSVCLSFLIFHSFFLSFFLILFSFFLISFFLSFFLSFLLGNMVMQVKDKNIVQPRTICLSVTRDVTKYHFQVC